jgi:hypothetical protein
MSSTTETALASWRDTTTTRTILHFVAAAAEAPLVAVHRTIQDAVDAVLAGDLSRRG